jgi:hypothetical protein
VQGLDLVGACEGFLCEGSVRGVEAEVESILLIEDGDGFVMGLFVGQEKGGVDADDGLGLIEWEGWGGCEGVVGRDWVLRRQDVGVDVQPELGWEVEEGGHCGGVVMDVEYLWGVCRPEMSCFLLGVRWL